MKFFQDAETLQQAVDRLAPLAARGDHTKEWHNPPFLVGRIHVTTEDLRDLSVLLPWVRKQLRVSPTAAPSGTGKTRVIKLRFAEPVEFPIKTTRRQRFLVWFFNTDWLWTCSEDPRTESPRWFARPLCWFVFRFVYRAPDEPKTSS